jgi:hypothetical protein
LSSISTSGPKQAFELPAEPMRGKRIRSLLRLAIFLYLGLILCPIHYRAPSYDVDNTWWFALNYAAAHHLVAGRDVVWTYGPLAYLMVPFDLGNNLARGLAFQAGLWALLLLISWDVCFRGRFRLRNLAAFSLLIGLYVVEAPESPLSFAALMLLVQFRLRGGIARYAAALALTGMIPLIELAGTITAAGLVAGLIVDRLLSNDSNARLEAALAAGVPLAAAVVGCRLAFGSFGAIGGYIRSAVELTRGYSIAMSASGPRMELIAVLEAAALLATALFLLMCRHRREAWFFSLVLFVPLLINIKHGLVRQDGPHIGGSFCFIAMLLAVVALALPLNERFTLNVAVVVFLLFGVLWQDYVAANDVKKAVLSVTGARTPSLLWNALHFDRLHHTLEAQSRAHFPLDERVEPEIGSIIGREPVAFLSNVYSDALMDNLNLVLFPVIQRYSAYTPYLDGLNARWIDEKGPPFLIFDGQAIDGRHPWTETPATWAEVYRWYDTRLVGPRNLLLERRAEPRFTHFEPVGHQTLRFGEELAVPASRGPVFWTMECSLSNTGKLRALLLRVPPVMMYVGDIGGRTEGFRVLPPVLAEPSLGNYLPSSLDEFADVLSKQGTQDFSVARLKFASLGHSAYKSDCVVEFFRAAP